MVSQLKGSYGSKLEGEASRTRWRHGGFDSRVLFPWPQYKIMPECLALSVLIAAHSYSVSDRLYRRTERRQSYGFLRQKWRIVILPNCSCSTLMCTERILKWMEQNDSSTVGSSFMQAKKKIKRWKGGEGWEVGGLKGANKWNTWRILSRGTYRRVVH